MKKIAVAALALILLCLCGWGFHSLLRARARPLERDSALANRADELSARGQYHKAKTLYDRLVAAAPTDGELLLRRAAFYAEFGQFDSAMADVDSAIAKGYSPAQSNLVRALLLGRRGGRWDEQALYAQKALDTEPLMPDAMAALAEAQYHFGDYQNALKNISKAIAIHGNDTYMHALKARILLRAGDLAGAQKAAETAALSMDPQALVLAARVCHIQREFTKAAAYYGRASAQVPKDYGIYREMAGALEDGGRLEAAARAYYGYINNLPYGERYAVPATAEIARMFYEARLFAKSIIAADTALKFAPDAAPLKDIKTRALAELAAAKKAGGRK